MNTILQKVQQPWIKPGTVTGEGPLYTSDAKLLFVDIGEKRLFRVDTKQESPRLESYDVPELPSLVAEIEGRPTESLLGVKSGFAIWNWQTKTLKPLVDIRDTDESTARRMRMNDGAVDCQGRMWAGSMIDTSLPDEQGREVSLFDGKSRVDVGTLYRLDQDLVLSEEVNGATISNGIGWNPDNTVMYWVDSVPQMVYAFDFDASSGSISNKRRFYHHQDAGVPDGLAVDIEGNVWVALYGGGAVLKISPTGSLIGEIRLPVSIVTCPCFGGPDMDELFITTGKPAEGGESDGQGLDGAVFRVKVGVKGLPKHKFHLH